MNDKTSPSPSVVPRIVRVIAITAVHFVALGIAIVFLCAIVPIYIELFEQYDVALPQVTVQIVELSLSTSDFWYLVILLCVVCDASIVAWLTFIASKRTWILTIYSHLWLLGVIVFLFWCSVVICIPIHDMNEDANWSAQEATPWLFAQPAAGPLAGRTPNSATSKLTRRVSNSPLKRCWMNPCSATSKNASTGSAQTHELRLICLFRTNV